MGTSVSLAFKSILKDPKYYTPVQRRPIWVRTDKGKEFLNGHFQDMLKHEGIQFQVRRNPDIKCEFVERAQRTVRDRLYRYFTYINAYRYTDVLPNSLKHTIILLFRLRAWRNQILQTRTVLRYGRK